VIHGSNYEYTGTITILTQVFFGVMMASMNFGMSSPYIEAFAIAKGAGAKVFSVIHRVSPINSFSKDGKRPEQMYGNIRFTDVHFEYPSRADVKVGESNIQCALHILTQEFRLLGCYAMWVL
jgi:hypothetical protein